MTKIRDDHFPTSAQINELACFASDRYLERVTESVTVLQCCQDSNNTSLVIVDFVLVGAFYFTPVCKILEVDGDTSYTTNNTIARLALGHYKNPNIPIDTQCNTFHGQLVFDFGQVISDFLEAHSIKFELTMVGQVPQSYGINFTPQSPSYIFEWEKGVLPQPVSITYQNGSYNVVFEYAGNKDCSCSIQCVVPSGISNNIQFCPDQKQTVTIYNGGLLSDPTTLLISLRDSVGNISALEIQPLMGVDPAPPTISYNESPRHVSVTILAESIGGIKLENTQYQVLKYDTNQHNYFVWKDWSNRSSMTFLDDDLLPGHTYGYAVRYRGQFNDITNLSSWSSIIV